MVLDEVFGLYAQKQSRDAIQNALQAHPETTLIASMSDQGSLGAEAAVKAAGKKVGDGGIVIASRGSSALGLKAVRGGRFFALDLTIPGTEGQLAAHAIIARARGAKFPDSRDQHDGRARKPP